MYRRGWGEGGLAATAGLGCAVLVSLGCGRVGFVAVDAGRDARGHDAGIDSGLGDAGPSDAGRPDGGPDAGSLDAGPSDAYVPPDDAGMTDGGPPDAGSLSIQAGCADGLREGFADMLTHLRIAGCSGGFALPGVVDVTAFGCARAAGDDGANPHGAGCNIGDLCAVGWHVCRDAADVAVSSPSGCAGATTSGDPPLFFATRQSGPGDTHCGAGHNDVFGCGNVVHSWMPNALGGTECAPLDTMITTTDIGSAPWDPGVDSENEALNITKPGPATGGALCCRD